MKIHALAVILLALGVMSRAGAQSNEGDLSGRVIDRITKQPLPGANVQILGTDIGAATGLDGSFELNRLKEDIYKLKVSFIGYQTHVETDVRVIRGKSTRVEDIELAMAAVELQGVVVTTSLFEEEPQAPVSRHTYTREEIRRSPGSSGDVFRAMETLPGVSTAGGEFSAFSVRSGSPKENIILIDNIPFDKVTHFTGGSEEQEAQGGRFSIFAPGLIEEASFQAGGFSAVYGGRFSSFLDLKIKEGNTANPTFDGRVDILGMEANYDGPLPAIKNTSLVLSARRQDFTPILKLTGQGEFGSPRFIDIIAKTTTELNARNKISLLAIYAPEWFDRTGEDVYESEDFALTDITDLDEEKALLGLNWRHLVSNRGFWQNAAWFRATNRDGTQGRAWPAGQNGMPPASASEIATRALRNERVDETEFGLRSVFTYMPGAGMTLTSGLELSRTAIDLKREQFGLDTLFFFDRTDFRPDSQQKYVLARPEFVDREFNDANVQAALFAELNFQPFRGLTLNAGLRFESNQFNSARHLAPRFSGSYRAGEGTRLNFAAGVYHQTPELDVLTADARNSGLKDERANHFIAGITQYLRPDLRLTAELYYKRFDRLIVRGDRANQVRTNAGDGEAAGVDLSLVKRFVKKVYGQINYSFAYSKRDDHDGAGRYNSDFHQPHLFAVLAGYEFNKEWTLSAKWRFASGRPTDAFIIHRDIFQNPAFFRYSKEITDNNGDRLPDFHTFNIRVDYRKQLGRLALVSFFDIVNVYNHLNVNEARFLELTGEEDLRGFRILPTAGVKVEF